MKSASLGSAKRKKSKISSEKKSVHRNSDGDEKDKETKEEAVLTVSELS